jgi:integrase
VAELLARYWRHVEEHYPSREPTNIRYALRHVRRLYGHTAAADFGPQELKAIRGAMIVEGWSRKHINAQINRVRRFFYWCIEEALIPSSVRGGLAAVKPLKYGRTSARETDPVPPVPDEFVAAIREHTSRPVWAMVCLQTLTGMRPGEVCQMRPCDINMGNAVWKYTPERHKTQHFGHTRVIYLHANAQAVIRPFLSRAVSTYLFSPAEAMAEHRAERHRGRATPVSCGNRVGTNRKAQPKRQPSDRYDTQSYGHAIRHACDRADRAARIRAAADGGGELCGDCGGNGRDARKRCKACDGIGRIVPRLIPRWSPNRLRHSAATLAREVDALEGSQALLGHATLRTTEEYAELRAARASEIAAQVDAEAAKRIGGAA